MTGETNVVGVREVPTERSHVEARTLATGRVVWSVKVVIGATDQELRHAVDQAKDTLAYASRLESKA